jgi:RND family efflux transporter MFP subunit
VRVAEAKLSVAESDRRRAAAVLAYREIRAPFDGVVTRKGVDTGDFLQPSVSGTPSGKALYVVVRADLVKVMIDVPESDAHGVKAGTVAKVRVPSLGEREFEGKVTRTSLALDQQSRTLRAQIEMPNPDGVLRPGLYVSARIGSSRSNVLTVPASSVFVLDDQAMVVRVEDGKARRTPVKLGARQGGRVELLKKQTRPAPRGEPVPWEDLTGTEELIVEKPAGWTDGQPVRAESKAAAAGPL